MLARAISTLETGIMGQIFKTLGYLAALAGLLMVGVGHVLGAESGAQDQQTEKPFRAALLYDLGGKFDRSFNESAWNGAEAFRKETGFEYRDFEPTSEIQYEQALRRYARRGYDAIIVVGFGYAIALNNVAQEFPEIPFTAIDAVVQLPNVRSVTFKEHEGSYLAGVVAALQSESGQVGFLGGMDIPLIRRFEHGYRQGVEQTNPAIRVISNYIGTTPSAWNDPIKAADLARGQYSRGVDVIYHAAGPSGLGLIQAAKDTGKFAIGVDSNQNPVAPGNVLTSMLKRVDRGVYTAMMDTLNGRWTPGIVTFGLKEDGVALAVDEHNNQIYTSEMRAAVEAATNAIVSGDIKVRDALTGEGMPDDPDDND